MSALPFAPGRPIRPPLRVVPIDGANPSPASPDGGRGSDNTKASTNSPSIVDDLEHQFRRFLAIDAGQPLVLALWSLATHIYDSFDAFPYLAITSPTKRCGKTRAAELLELFCASPFRTVGMTPAVLFRSIEQDRPTLIVDEAESLRGSDERSSALREILNAGYRRGQKVRRCQGDGKGGQTLRDFETYCPKVLVLIRKLPDTLADRTIAISMRRRSVTERVDRFIVAQVEIQAAPIRQACEQWASTHIPEVVNAYQGKDLRFLQDREAELWLPLFVVCELAAPHRLAELETIARKLAHEKAADESGDMGIRLLADVRDIFTRSSTGRVHTQSLLSDLNHIEEAPWQEYCGGKALNARALARLLHPFGVWPQDIRIGPAVAKGYMLESFKDAFARYLPPASATPLQGQ